MKTLIPGNLFFNMGVDGFIRTLMYGIDPDYVWNECLKPDGTLVLSDELLECLFSHDAPTSVPVTTPPHQGEPHVWRITHFFAKMTNEMYLKERKSKSSDVLRSLFSSNKTAYPNLFAGANRNGETIVEAFQQILAPRNGISTNKGMETVHCSFCGGSFPLNLEKPEENFLSNTHLRESGSFQASFPNSFWNNTPQIFLCPFCRNMLFFRHLSSYSKSRFFVNASSFQVNYALNELQTSMQKVRWTDVIPFVVKNFQTIGMWTLSGIEVVENNYSNGVQIRTFPKELAVFFLLPGVIKNIQVVERLPAKKLGLTSAMESIQKRTFGDFLLNAYRLLREKTEPYNYQRFILAYLSLFREITGGETQVQTDIWIIQKETQKIPAGIQHSLLQTKFRLLEQARMENKPEVLAMITRAFLAHGKKIPPFLLDIFEIMDMDSFKTEMFAFLGCLEEKKGKEDKKEVSQ